MVSCDELQEHLQNSDPTLLDPSSLDSPLHPLTRSLSRWVLHPPTHTHTHTQTHTHTGRHTHSSLPFSLSPPLLCLFFSPSPLPHSLYLLFLPSPLLPSSLLFLPSSSTRS